ncbi:MAG: polysaccharide biosynthesis tyrosine autokinase [Actinobacteria bacterium]|nr:polysaccharide biosynthesis tyrosine autokinase [Actinomycetota bacterium]
MEPRDDAVDLRFYLGVLRRRAWVVVLATVAVAALAYGVSLTQSDVYEAGADVLIGRQASDQVFVIGQGYDPRRNVQTEVRILGSRTVSDAASEAVGAAVSVRIVADDESDVVRVIARSSAPSFAARDANAYAKAYVDYRLGSTVQRLIAAGDEVTSKIAEIDTQIAALPATSTRRAPLEDQRAYLVEQQGRLEVSANLADAGGAAVLAEADVPTAPVEPKPLRNALLGAFLGLLLGVGIALLLEYLDDTVKDHTALERILGPGLPVLTEVPSLGGRREKVEHRLVVVDEPTSPAAEAIGMLRTSLLFRALDGQVTSYQVTSAIPGEGKTTVAANLAASLAGAGKRVVVVDLDLRRPRLHLYFGLANRVGVTSVLLGDVSVRDAMRRVAGVDGLFVMPSGPVPANPAEIMASSRLAELLGVLVAPIDLMIVDSPPVLAVSDAMALARIVDATILVARAGKSSRRAIQRAVSSLRQVKAPLLGAVLNDVSSDAGGYGYGSGYGDAPDRNPVPNPPRRRAPAPPKR